MAKEVFLFEHNEKAYEVGVDTIASELVNIEDISTFYRRIWPNLLIIC